MPVGTSSAAADVERAITRYQPPDWNARNVSIVNKAQDVRAASVNLRTSTNSLRVETDAKTKWDNYDNNIRLSERAQQIERWRDQLTKLQNEIREESSVLSEAKEACERSLEAKNLPLEIVGECLTLRETRREFEVVRDPVEAALRSEVRMIEEVRLSLREHCEEAWDQLAALDTVAQKVEIDLEDKTEALRIDIEQLCLTERSTGISHKPNPTRLPQGSLQTAAWHDHSMLNKEAAEKVLWESRKLRERIFHHIEQTTNALKSKIESTNFDFRKRLYDVRRAKEEIEYQIKVTEDEMEEQKINIRNLEASLEAKIRPLKLAETRLENRTLRPNVELCVDAPLEGLVEEVRNIQQTITLLQDKLEETRETHSELETHLKNLQEDLARKNQAASLDSRCMDSRKRLTSHDTLVSSQTDAKIKMAFPNSSTTNRTRFLENATAVN